MHYIDLSPHLKHVVNSSGTFTTYVNYIVVHLQGIVNITVCKHEFNYTCKRDFCKLVVNYFQMLCLLLLLTELFCTVLP